jgi:hypothetical protein
MYLSGGGAAFAKKEALPAFRQFSPTESRVAGSLRGKPEKAVGYDTQCE